MLENGQVRPKMRQILGQGRVLGLGSRAISSHLTNNDCAVWIQNHSDQVCWCWKHLETCVDNLRALASYFFRVGRTQEEGHYTLSESKELQLLIFFRPACSYIVIACNCWQLYIYISQSWLHLQWIVGEVKSCAALWSNLLMRRLCSSCRTTLCSGPISQGGSWKQAQQVC